MKANRQGVDYTEELIRRAVGYGRAADNNVSNVKLVIQNALAAFEPKVLAAEEYINNGGVPMYFFLLKIVG